MSTEPKKTAREFSGIVTSTKMPKTLVVKVSRIKTHSKYGKKYTESKKYKVHYEGSEIKVGDKVNFVECRPISKDKKWRIVK